MCQPPEPLSGESEEGGQHLLSKSSRGKEHFLSPKTFLTTKESKTCCEVLVGTSETCMGQLVGWSDGVIWEPDRELSERQDLKRALRLVLERTCAWTEHLSFRMVRLEGHRRFSRFDENRLRLNLRSLR